MVVAIRGTWSMEDIITDSVADPMLLRDWLPKGNVRAGQIHYIGGKFLGRYRVLISRDLTCTQQDIFNFSFAQWLYKAPEAMEH